jgi:hypothetical protein
MKFAWVDSGDPAAADYRRAGEKLIDRIGGSLLSEVRRVVAEVGAAEAVGILHLKDFALPKPAAGQPRATAIKRTSLLLCNPANAPDGADQAALTRIKTELAEGNPPSKILVQKVDLPGGAVEWRVYRPIGVAASCLACHGDPESFEPGVGAALQRLYPENQAVGYSPSAWRGLIRVSLAPAEVVLLPKKPEPKPLNP